MISHRKGVLLDGIGAEFVRASTGGARKTLSEWLGDLSNAINIGDVASTFTSGDATPSVLNNSKFITAGSTTITNFDDGVEGQTITIYRGASNIDIADNATIDPIIAGAITLSATSPSVTFRLASGVWKQVAGVVTGAWADVVGQSTLALGLSAAGLGIEDSPTFAGITLTGTVSDTLAQITRTLDDATTAQHCFFDSTVINRTGNTAYNSFTSNINVTGNDDYDHFSGFQCFRTIQTSGTTATLWGFSDVTVVNTGTVTNRYAFYAFDVVGTGAVTNNYGLYVPSLTKGGTLNYAVYTAGTTPSAFGGAVHPTTDDAAALGKSGTAWSDLFLASGSVINFNAGDVLVTHSANLLAFSGASSGYSFDAAVKPSANDAAALGVSGTAWADLFLASGAVINFNAGDYTLTHSAGLLTANNPFTVSKNQAATTAIAVINTQVNASATAALTAQTTAGTAGLTLFSATNGTFPSGALFTAPSVLNIAPTGTLLLGSNSVVGLTITSTSVASSLPLNPSTNDGAAIGASGTAWSDLFLASGAVINFNAGDVTLTHSSNTLAFAGASSGYTFDAKPISTPTGEAGLFGSTGTDANNWIGLRNDARQWNVGIDGANADRFYVYDATAVAVMIEARTGSAWRIRPGTALTAAGSSAMGLEFSTSSVGVYAGSGAPTFTAARGSIYLRSDGSSTSTRLYVNTTGSTTWTNFTSAA